MLSVIIVFIVASESLMLKLVFRDKRTEQKTTNRMFGVHASSVRRLRVVDKRIVLADNDFINILFILLY